MILVTCLAIILSSIIAIVIFNLYKIWYEISERKFADGKMIITKILLEELANNKDIEIIKYLGYLLGFEFDSSVRRSK